MPSPKGSAPARTRNKIITPPARIDHFADVAIPGRVWSAFIPSGIDPRQVVRALMEHERGVIERRVGVLEPALLPFDPSLEGDDVVTALAEMFDSFRSMSGMKDENAVARVSQARDVLSDMPAWAIQETCMSIRRFGYRKEDGKLEQHWPPSDPEIHAMVDKLIDGRRTALVQAKALLVAPLEPAAVERTASSIKSSLADFKDKMGKATAIDEEDERRRRVILDRNKERALQDRRQEYIDAGLEPPAAKYGFLTSLPMMLQQGWTIETIDEFAGKQVLVSPKKVTV